METRHLIMMAILSGKRTQYSISEKFAYILKGDFKSFIDHVDNVSNIRNQSIRDKFKQPDNEAMVSFYSDGALSNIRIEGIDRSGDMVELFVKLDDETGEAFHWGIKKI